jgi:hypothetical protein
MVNQTRRSTYDFGNSLRCCGCDTRRKGDGQWILPDVGWGLAQRAAAGARETSTAKQAHLCARRPVSLAVAGWWGKIEPDINRKVSNQSCPPGKQSVAADCFFFVVFRLTRWWPVGASGDRAVSIHGRISALIFLLSFEEQPRPSSVHIERTLDQRCGAPIALYECRKVAPRYRLIQRQDKQQMS